MDSLEGIKQGRLQKLENLKKAGINPYPAHVLRTNTNQEVLDNFDKLAKPAKGGSASGGKKITLVGRVRAIRGHGGSTFFNIEDGSTSLTTGAEIQAYLKKDEVGDKEYDLFINNIDIGDFVELNGTLFKTHKGEKTLLVKKWRILTKSLMPMPSEWYGLEDVEERFRKRYLDLVLNKDVRDKFKKRSEIISKIRKYLDENGFLEVETPILQTMAGGAKAKPFKTHLNALDIDLYLRIAPELYLKKLLVGGFEKVYELGRNFRNEGMDREHNPEFTMLEFYAAYWDYETMMDFTEKLLKTLDKKIFSAKGGSASGGKFRREEYEKIVGNKDEKEVFGKIKEPTFVINHPVEISPLSKRMDNNAKKVARFQLIVNGLEICNGFSELNDPIDQKERFKMQELERRAGNEETHPYDTDFVEALEYGMPPAAGIGIGIDRLATLLIDSKTLREIILFPTMKPKND